MLAGNGVIRGHATATLVRFANKLNITVTTTFMAKGVIPDTHPLALGAIGLQSADYVNCTVAEADVAIAFRYDVVGDIASSLEPKARHALCRID